MKYFICLMAVLFFGCNQNITNPPEDKLEPLKNAVAKNRDTLQLYGSNALPQLQISPCAAPYSVVYQGDTIISFNKESLGCPCFFVKTALIRGERYIYIDYTYKGGYEQGKLFIGKDLVLSEKIEHFCHYQGSEYVLVYLQNDKEVWCVYNDSTYTLIEKGRI